MSGYAQVLVDDVLAQEVSKLRMENSRLRREVARLGDENSAQCDVIAELQEMVNRAYVAPESGVEVA